jgi:hypothetical protein
MRYTKKNKYVEQVKIKVPFWMKIGMGPFKINGSGHCRKLAWDLVLQ